MDRLVPTIYVSGVHSGPNPSPGLGVARCLQEAYPEARLVAVDYSPRSSGLHSDLFDEVWLERPWTELDLPTHLQEIRNVLDSGSFWLSCLDLEITWLADNFAPRPNLPIPSDRALSATAKPAFAAGRRLPVTIPDFLPTTRPETEFHAFCRRHDWRVWLKGPYYEARRVGNWPRFLRARAELGATWPTDRLFLQAHVRGTEESIACTAHKGRLLGAVRMEKRVLTEQGKTWAGRVSDVPQGLLAPLEQTLADLEWTGGGELELVRNHEGKLHLIDWNPRFPAWVFGAALAGSNLPALLLEAAGAGKSRASPAMNKEFTRVVIEIPVRPGLSLPPALVPDPTTSSASKHPSGMPDLARKLRDRGPTPRRRAPRVSREVLSALEDVGAEGAATPARVLLPAILQARLEELRRASAEASRDGLLVRFAYSVKTNPDQRILREVKRAGLLAEVISRGEVRHTRRCGFPPDRLVVNGPLGTVAGGSGKSPFRAWFADSLEVLGGTLGSGRAPARFRGVRLRLPGVASRFGVDVSDPGTYEALVLLLRRADSHAALALHFHVPSDAVGIGKWWQLWESFLAWAEAIGAATGRPVLCLDAGGGWFPEDFDREFLPRFRAAAEEASRRLPQLEEMIVEPGKAIVQPAMVLVATVVEVRRTASGRREAVVDAATCDLPLARSFPHRILARDGGNGWRALAGGEDRILGGICMEQDVLADELQLPRGLRAGDRLVFCDAGAYDASMAYDFGRGDSRDG